MWNNWIGKICCFVISSPFPSPPSFLSIFLSHSSSQLCNFSQPFPILFFSFFPLTSYAIFLPLSLPICLSFSLSSLQLKHSYLSPFSIISTPLSSPLYLILFLPYFSPPSSLPSYANFFFHQVLLKA